MRDFSRTSGSRIRNLVAILVVAVAVVVGCGDFLDPTKVTNPQTTPEDLAQAREPTRVMLGGMRAQFARAVGSVATITENVSDNYSIHGTGLLADLDEPAEVVPRIIDGTDFATGVYWNPQELRALADFVLDSIIPGDETATPAQIAEVEYYRGMALLLQAENFVAAPTGPDEAPSPGDQLLQAAISQLQAVTSTDPGSAFATRAQAALARAHRVAGNATEAVGHANDVLAADPGFLFVQGYDALPASVNNPPNIYTVQRALKEMQPLPRLDFLDPKFIGRESPIPVSKAEEMHLILAEAAMAGGDWAGGRESLAQALELALTRPVDIFFDDDARNNADLSIRPRTSDMLVRSDPDSPFREGLVLDRPGNIATPAVSGTSLDPDSIRAIAATEEESLLHALNLARQEILFLEGRRMSDLCIRLPMMLREVDTNPAVQDGDFGTRPFVPAFIPPRNEMDLYDPPAPYDEDDPDLPALTTEITILVDMNWVLAQSRAPFAPCPAP